MAPARAATPSPAASRSPGPRPPTRWSNNFFENVFGFEYKLVKSRPVPTSGLRKVAPGTVPDAHDPSKRHAPTMLTTDLSLRFDPAYEKISRRFYEHPEEFADAFARAWFQADAPRHGAHLPVSRSAGSGRAADLAGPRPRVDHELIGDQDIAALKGKILGPGRPSHSWSRPPGHPRPRSAAPTGAAGQRSAHPPRPAEGLGGEQPVSSWRRC